MISIITAIYNGLPVNKIYMEYLQANTYHPFELIIIDNGSTDGSAKFFESHGAKVIRNPANYSYPYTQNQGIKASTQPYLAFLNNDIIVAPYWDKHLIETSLSSGSEIITSCGIEQLENDGATEKIRRRWKLIKNILGIAGLNEPVLRLMHRLMYGNWKAFCQKRWMEFGMQTKEGFVGHSVFMARTALDKVGLWDERIQAADFDLYIRSKKREMESGDIKPVHIALGVFNHHFIRVTLKSRPPAFADKANMISLEEKWTEAERTAYLSGIYRK